MYSNPGLKFLIVFVFLLTKQHVFSQDTIEQKFYSNGKIKVLSISRGIDTVEYRSYYKNGQLKDSLWLYVKGNVETGLGTGKKYYEDGKPESVIYYTKTPDEYTDLEYWKNGQLKRFEQHPTGLTKFYNKKGKQTREYDEVNLANVYVPAIYKKGRHLDESYRSRITDKEAVLMQNDKKVKLVPGVLVSFRLRSDTGLFTHCLVEGFSKDSVYVSRFNYNQSYKGRGTGHILNYDRTFGVAFSALDTLFYARHHTSKRNTAASASLLAGFEVLIALAALTPFLARNAEPATLPGTAIVYGATIVVAVPLIYLGKYLYRSAVPQKYDMNQWKIVVRP